MAIDGNEKWSNLSIRWYKDVKKDLFFCYQWWRCKRLQHDHLQVRINFRYIYIYRWHVEWTIDEEEKREVRKRDDRWRRWIFKRVLYSVYTYVYIICNNEKKKEGTPICSITFTVYRTITFVKMWVSKQLSCTDFLIVVVVVVVDHYCLHNFSLLIHRIY